MMKRPNPCIYWICAALLANTLMVSPGFHVSAEAAKKYYPPGFKLPVDFGGATEPATPPTQTETPIEEPTPSHPSVILKVVTPHFPAKPKDLLTELLSDRRFYEALRLIDQRIKKAPTNLSLHLLRGQVLRDDENFQESATEYRLVLEKTKAKPLQARAWSGLGMTQLAQGQHADSLGDHYGSQTLTQEALSFFQKSLKFSPKLGEAWLGVAQVAMAQNRLHEAETALQKANQYGIPKVLSLLTKGQLLMAAGKPNQALPIAFLAKKEADNDPRVYLLLGQVSLALERTDDTIIHLKQALDRTPDHPEALRLLSLAYERKMKPEDAELVLQKAISLNPGDVESVRALLKIYDQRGELERSVLLLKTLVFKPLETEESSNHQPVQLIYQKALLERLCQAHQWEEAFQEGSKFITTLPPIEATPSPTGEIAQEVLHLFAKAAYGSGRGLLDHTAFLGQPAVHRSIEVLQGHLAINPMDLKERLDMLLLDPLAVLPPFPQGYQPTLEDLPLALQVSFLTGNVGLHQSLLDRYLQEGKPSPEALLQTADTLLQLGDYTGGGWLSAACRKAAPDNPAAKAMEGQVAEAKRRADEQLKVLEVLPRNIPASHWERAAEEALLVSRGDWRLHGVLADAFYQQKRYQEAMTHQRLAAQYAPSERERERWLKKVGKTLSLLEHQKVKAEGLTATES